MNTHHNPLQIYITKERGYCGGVKRALKMLDDIIAQYQPPIYVLHDIVHNEHVLSEYKKKGVIFVEHIDQIPQNVESPVLLSAHGTSPEIKKELTKKGFIILDTVCPLVVKIHERVIQNDTQGCQTILIGSNKNHQEIRGILGQVPSDNILFIREINDIEKIKPFIKNEQNLFYETQTTLSVYETEKIISYLKKVFPYIRGAEKGDICPSSTLRQKEVYELVQKYKPDVFFVIGSQTSSNSKRLAEVVKDAGCADVYLISGWKDIDMDWLKNARVLGITTGASTPDFLVEEIVRNLEKYFRVVMK